MRHCLDQRQPVFPRANRPLEQRHETLHRNTRFGQIVVKPCQRAMVIVDHLAQPQRQAGKRQLMPGQNQLRRIRHRQQPLAAFQPVAHRVGLRLGRIHPQIGRDRRKDLIAANHQRLAPAPKGRMLRRMAIADMNIPIASTHADGIALPDALKPERQRADHIREIERSFRGPRGEQRPIHPRPAPERQSLGRWHRLHIQHQHPRHQPGRPRDDQFRPARLKPARQTDMIRVMMRHHQPAHRTPAKWPSQQPLPDRAAALAVHPGVNHRPAIAVVQRIDIDMIQLHRQRQPHPQNARCHLHRRALNRRHRERIPDAALVQLGNPVHHAARSSGDSA